MQMESQKKLGTRSSKVLEFIINMLALILSWTGGHLQNVNQVLVAWLTGVKRINSAAKSKMGGEVQEESKEDFWENSNPEGEEKA